MTSRMMESTLTRDAGVRVPIICGPMYPCSNPELVGAVSAAGGIGIIQPISLTYVHGHEYREGLRLAMRLAGGRPIGMNALIEQSSKAYRDRMERWIDVALEEGVRFVVTSLGNPRWVADRVHAAGGRVYHDVTERRWALKARDGDVDGFICVNARAGGHSGGRSAEALYDELADLGLPMVCAGGVGDEGAFVEAMQLGYAGVQMGTRFIATAECIASTAYKEAIVRAAASDIVHTERITGVPVAVINTPYIQHMGLRAGPIARRLLRGRRTKHWMRTFYALRSLWQLKRSSLPSESTSHEYWQAGMSVEGIDGVEPAAAIVERFADALGAATRAPRVGAAASR